MAFENVGLEPGIEIWRIEDFEAVPYDNHGKFHMGDSYIVLKVNMTLNQNYVIVSPFFSVVLK